jgi:TRAP-type C4-dicarboxylate transport system permease small subunit
VSNVNNVGDRATKRMRRIARIWGALLIACTLLIFIGYAWNWLTTGKADPHAAEDYPPIENVPPLFCLLSVLGLGIAWRREGLGAAITIVFSLATLPVLLIHWPITHNFPRYLVAPYGTWMIIAIPGGLFLICWQRTKKRMIPQRSA